MKQRTSYLHLMAHPAWGLYAGSHLVASVRADNAHDARDIFHAHNLEGERVRLIPPVEVGRESDEQDEDRGDNANDGGQPEVREQDVNEHGEQYRD
jgi:hypothetical protein